MHAAQSAARPQSKLIQSVSVRAIKKKTIVIQSYASRAQPWIRRCASSVELWCVERGVAYFCVGDKMFDLVAARHQGFATVTRTDIARLRLIQNFLDEYEDVYWLDADFLIWDRANFWLPRPQPGAAVCAREAFHQHTGSTSLAFNNSVLGFCDRNDVEVLIEKSEAILDAWREKKPEQAARPAIVGTDLFSSWRFPLRRIVAKQCACFSAQTINLILGEWLEGRHHLYRLCVASGAQLAGANLCSSRENDNLKMIRLIVDLTESLHLKVGRAANFAWIYRGWLRLHNFPDRVRCWLLTRWRNITRA